jgi:hypothetical protein
MYMAEVFLGIVLCYLDRRRLIGVEFFERLELSLSFWLMHTICLNCMFLSTARHY